MTKRAVRVPIPTISLDTAISSFARTHMREEIDRHWRSFRPDEDFSEAYKAALDQQKAHFSDEKPLDPGEWIETYAAKFAGARLNQLGKVVVEYKAKGEDLFETLELFKRFTHVKSQPHLLRATRDAIDAHMYPILPRAESAFLKHLIATKARATGVRHGKHETVEITVPHSRWSRVDYKTNSLIISNEEIYEEVKVRYITTRLKATMTKADEMAGLMSELLTFEEISSYSADEISHKCAQKIKNNFESDPSKYSKIIKITNGVTKLLISKNTVDAAKKLHLEKMKKGK